MAATDDTLSRVREICLALPEATEKQAWGAPTFRVRDKLNHHGDGRLAIWCKAPPGAQDLLVESDPERFFVPPYVGHRGWVGVRLEGKPDWDAIADLLEDGYRLTAPERLLAALDEG
jgi:hypothetical protein